MLIGYVSDERYVALADVEIQLEGNGDRRDTVSTPHGGVYADVEPGRYRVSLTKEGYHTKRTEVAVGEYRLSQFRLLSTEATGYAWPLWCTTEDETEVFIDSEESATVELWRHGFQKEHVRSDTCDAHCQDLPEGDFVSTGVEWDPAFTVPAPDRTGLYYFHLETSSEERFSFPWVVAPDTPNHRIAVIASTNTWNAYNAFGGRSNYLSPAGLERVPWVESEGMTVRERRWYHPNDSYRPLSFKRPNSTVDLSPEEEIMDPYDDGGERHTAGAEWRLLGWLEREAYGYDLYADGQLHDGTLDLSSYDTLIVHTHPEYWSHEMYRRVKTWVTDEGGRLAYLGGNGINAEVEVVAPDQIRIRNCLRNVAYDAKHHADTPPSAYESRFHASAEAEGELLGTVYTSHGIQTAAPYAVRKPEHWVFDGVNLDTGDTFGHRTLQRTLDQGASGHELDKLSIHAPSDTEVLAKGTNPEGSGAEMVYHELGNGAVFSVGSITYPSALLVDEDISTITATVLGRFTRQ